MYRSTISFANAIDLLVSSGRQTIISNRPPGFRALPDIAHAGSRILEEHGAEPGERDVELRLELGGLGVDGGELRVVEAGRGGVAARDLEERLAAVGAERTTARADAFRDLQRGLAEAAAHVEHPVAGLQAEAVERAAAVCVAHRDEQFTEAEERLIEHVVPELDVLGIGGWRDGHHRTIGIDCRRPGTGPWRRACLEHEIGCRLARGDPHGDSARMPPWARSAACSAASTARRRVGASTTR